MLDSHLDWETREQYLQLLEKLINRKIDTFKFCIEFKKRNESPHEKSVKYSIFVIHIPKYSSQIFLQRNLIYMRLNFGVRLKKFI